MFNLWQTKPYSVLNAACMQKMHKCSEGFAWKQIHKQKLLKNEFVDFLKIKKLLAGGYMNDKFT